MRAACAARTSSGCRRAAAVPAGRARAHRTSRSACSWRPRRCSPAAAREIDLPVKVQLAKMRDEGGYASVIGGLSRFWTLITERVNGTFHVNSMQLRRAPQSEPVARGAARSHRRAVARPEASATPSSSTASEAWTVQRLRDEPLGETRLRHRAGAAEDRSRRRHADAPPRPQAPEGRERGARRRRRGREGRRPARDLRVRRARERRLVRQVARPRPLRRPRHRRRHRRRRSAPRLPAARSATHAAFIPSTTSSTSASDRTTGASIGGAVPSRSMRIGCSPAPREPSTSARYESPTYTVSSARTSARASAYRKMSRCGFDDPTTADATTKSISRVISCACRIGSRSLPQSETTPCTSPRARPASSAADRLRERLPLRRVGVPVVQRLAGRADLAPPADRRRCRAARTRSTPSRTCAPPGPTRTSPARPRPAASRRTPRRPETRPRCSRLDRDAELVRQEVPDLVDLGPRLHQRVPGVVEDRANHRSG